MPGTHGIAGVRRMKTSSADRVPGDPAGRPPSSASSTDPLLSDATWSRMLAHLHQPRSALRQGRTRRAHARHMRTPSRASRREWEYEVRISMLDRRALSVKSRDTGATTACGSALVVKLNGCIGQSFGCWNAGACTVSGGRCNDYVGKAWRRPHRAQAARGPPSWRATHHHGNTCLYAPPAASSMRPAGGERFAVRNSGASRWSRAPAITAGEMTAGWSGARAHGTELRCGFTGASPSARPGRLRRSLQHEHDDILRLTNE